MKCVLAIIAVHFSLTASVIQEIYSFAARPSCLPEKDTVKTIDLILFYNKQIIADNFTSLFIYPLARREAPAEGRTPEGEGANIDRRLVPYHAKCMRIQSHIEFIYLFIYLYICINRVPHARGIGIYSFFFPKRNIIFLGTKERNLENKTSLYYYG